MEDKFIKRMKIKSEKDENTEWYNKMTWYCSASHYVLYKFLFKEVRKFFH